MAWSSRGRLAEPFEIQLENPLRTIDQDIADAADGLLGYGRRALTRATMREFLIRVDLASNVIAA